MCGKVVCTCMDLFFKKLLRQKWGFGELEKLKWTFIKGTRWNGRSNGWKKCECH